MNKIEEFLDEELCLPVICVFCTLFIALLISIGIGVIAYHNGYQEHVSEIRAERKEANEAKLDDIKLKRIIREVMGEETIKHL
jgi:hypothetical protein|tara:strand:+ start:9025 stop:9273 length:249 start_codon:yes stop_codon:yes gene_type:complete